MDIEGAELAALNGAKEIIYTQKPKLAISVYHKIEDIFTIKALFFDSRGNYSIRNILIPL
jgi:hypothetical protein